MRWTLPQATCPLTIMSLSAVVHRRQLIPDEPITKEVFRSLQKLDEVIRESGGCHLCNDRLLASTSSLSQ
jgi:hypothetical protein